VPSFGHRAPKTFVVSRVIGLSFVIHKESLSVISESPNEVTLREHPDNFRMGLVARRKTNHQIRGLEFLAPPPITQKGRGTAD